MITESQKKNLKPLNSNEKVLNLTSEEDIKLIQDYIKQLNIKK